MTLFPDLVTGQVDRQGVEWRRAALREANWLLAAHHYLGPAGAARLVYAGFVRGEMVACQVWRWPTSRNLPSDGSWLELARWCLTPAAGPNAGSRMHRHATAELAASYPALATLVSYSDPSQGHTGALYRACNWLWAPTWQRLRPPPSGNGSWTGRPEAVKDRWLFRLRRDPRWAELVAVDDPPALRAYLSGQEWAERTSRWPSTLR